MNYVVVRALVRDFCRLVDESECPAYARLLRRRAEAKRLALVNVPRRHHGAQTWGDLHKLMR